MARTTCCGAAAKGYETLLNTQMSRERPTSSPGSWNWSPTTSATIGFTGTLLIEPKPQEPTKHQYDYDCATVHGFLDRYGLARRVPGEHRGQPRHPRRPLVPPRGAYAIDNGIFGSVDANRGDPQNGWDTDQFPNSVDELSLAMFEILRAGGLGPDGVATGGFNFDTKLRRQSLDRTDLFHGHIGGIDTLAQSLLVAEAMIEDGAIDRFRTERYSRLGRRTRPGDRRLADASTLAGIADRATDEDLSPQPVSGRQELLENEVNRVIWETT